MGIAFGRLDGKRNRLFDAEVNAVLGTKMLRVLMICLLWPSFLVAGDYREPERGSATRSSMMNAIRPHAEWNFGPPVEFVVSDLRVSGNVGYASLEPQRPGGDQIDLATTPMAAFGGYDPEFSDGASMHVLYQLSGGTWVAVHWSIGATDVWFAAPEFCRIWVAVIPEFCGG